MIVGPEIWDVLDRAAVVMPTGSSHHTESFNSTALQSRYNRLFETIAILNQLFTKAKMEIA